MKLAWFMRKAVLAMIVMVVSAFLCAQRARAETSEGPYPVWWEPIIKAGSEYNTIRLERLEDAKRYMREKLPNDLYVQLYKDGDKEKEFVVADTCVSFDSLTRSGFSSGNDRSSIIANDIANFCRTLELLDKAKPAQKSFVNDFVFDEHALDYLPAFLEGVTSCDFLCRHFLVNRERIPFSRAILYEYDKIRVVNENRMELVHKNMKSTLVTEISLIARGDFDHDGLEDLLIHMDAEQYRTVYRDLFVVTREAADDVLYLLYPEKHVCPVDYYYKCSPVSHDISEWRKAE